MGGLPEIHVNTTLLILMSALYADAHLFNASPACTKDRRENVWPDVLHAVSEVVASQRSLSLQAVASTPNDARHREFNPARQCANWSNAHSPI